MGADEQPIKVGEIKDDDKDLEKQEESRDMHMSRMQRLSNTNPLRLVFDNTTRVPPTRVPNTTTTTHHHQQPPPPPPPTTQSPPPPPPPPIVNPRSIPNPIHIPIPNTTPTPQDDEID